jgi:hypothetical protein
MWTMCTVKEGDYQRPEGDYHCYQKVLDLLDWVLFTFRMILVKCSCATVASDW